MSMSEARDAMPSSRIRAADDRRLPQEIGAQRRRSAMTNRASLIFALVTKVGDPGEGIASRAPTSNGLPDRVRFSPAPGRADALRDEVGLYNVVDRMKRFAANPHGDPGFWKPAPLLASWRVKERGSTRSPGERQ